jgi:ACS family hexuronate transporter-like MFS transporter
MNIKEIALFAWLPFLAADIGGILGGYLCPFFMEYFKMSVLNSRLAVWWSAPEANREVVAEL